MDAVTMQIVATTYRFGSVQYDLTSRTFLMGILNVTPDSFSDGGKFYDSEKAVRHGLELVEQGADFLDVGGESARPGSDAISIDEELRRVLPVIERLAKATQIPVSIDTYKSEVAARALDAGAVIVNDISGLHFDSGVAGVVAEHHASMILMHIKGTPKTMQQDPQYQDMIEEVCEYLQEGIQIAERKGIKQLIVDPGIGFGKTLSHNLEIIRKLSEFQRFGYPIMVGPSRKSFIGTLLNAPIEQRLEGTAGAVAVSIMNGANIIRVHDVKEMKQVASVVDGIRRDM